MRVAALYDIHANLPALEAVLGEVRDAGVDHVLVRETGYPQAEDFAAQHVLASPSESAMLEAFTHASFP